MADSKSKKVEEKVPDPDRPDGGLSNDSQFSKVVPNPDPNPNNEEPPPGPSVVEVLGQAKETGKS